MKFPVVGTARREGRSPAGSPPDPAAQPSADPPAGSAGTASPTSPAADAGGRPGGHIRLDGLGKRYGAGPPAVSGVDLDIAPGEFLTLLGPSGSGKTTILNMIAGFVDPTEGRVLLGGRDVSALPPHRRGFGMVFQSYALFPHLTVAQNIAFPLRERRTGRAETARRVAEVMELTDLLGKEDRRPHELSGGQQQRVALARAVVFNPSVLLLDEPLSALDRKLRQSLQREIKRLHDELRLTFVFVTHDQDEAMTLSDRIAVFREGALERVGTPAELYREPGTRFVARFLGESNVFDGALDGDAYRWRDRRWPLTAGAAGTGAADRLLVVRPERLGVLPESTPPPDGAATAPATVTDVSFYGTHQRVELRYEDGTTGCAVRPPGTTTEIAVGARVLAHWRPEDQVLVTR